jgi:hypothetical protein
MRAGEHRASIGQYGQKRFHIDHFHFTRVPCAAGLGDALANEKMISMDVVFIILRL